MSSRRSSIASNGPFIVKTTWAVHVWSSGYTVLHHSDSYKQTYLHCLYTSVVRNSLCFFTTHCSLRLTVRSELDVPTFATRRLHACHHARAPSGGRWNRVGEKYQGILPKFPTSTLHLGMFLHAVKLRHGADGFISPPKEGVLRIFFALKKSDGFGRV